MRLRALLRTSLLLALTAVHLTAFDIRTGENAPELERFAASELERYLRTLFPASKDATATIFLIGSPQTNPAVAEVLAGKPFESSVEGYSGIPAQYQGRAAFILAGQAPKGTLWAVYDLVEQWGVRYLLHGDVLPQRASFRIPAEFHREPVLPIRQWRVVAELAFGPASWGIADYKPFLDQLAKMRFNRILVSIWQQQPFLRYEYKGIARTSSSMFFGQRFPIAPDIPGRAAFPKDMTEFRNPDIPNEGDQLSAGIRHIRAIVAHAQARGMDIAISANLGDFPREFAPVIKDARSVRQVGEQTITPGPSVGVDDEDLAGLSATIVRSMLDIYPQARYLALNVPEHRQWIDEYERAWKYLDANYHLSEIESLDSILERSTKRRDFHGGPERAQAEVKGDIVSLYTFDRLLRERRIIEESTNPDAKLILSSVAEELLPLLPKILPPGSELQSFIDYTPSRVLRRVDALRHVPAADIPSVLIYTLHDDNVGILPQLSTHSLAQLTQELRRNGWKGFSTRYWMIGDHTAAAAYLARAGWDANANPEATYRDLFTSLCGPNCVSDALQALDALEKATVKLEWNGLGFAFPVDGMLMKHWSDKVVSPEVFSVRDDYTAAFAALQRAIRKSPKDRTTELRYLAGRMQFGIAYLDAIRNIQSAASAEKSGDHAGTKQFAAAALRDLTRAMELLAAVSRDQSDRGALASINEFGYQPLRKKIAELNKQ